MSITLDKLLTDFVESRSSDLHVTSDGVPYMRIHGYLYPMEGYEAIPDEHLHKMSLELVGEKHYNTLKKENELDAAVSFGSVRLRINMYIQQRKLAWALRALPTEFFPLENLGLPLNICQSAATLQKGLVLVTGATGSGKSTTLASIVNKINETRKCHIFTIEDPVEYQHFNKEAFISQREVGDDTASFHEALRRVLREDPDVVLIGEMRDAITMRAALTLAETGHLTFATLHTTDAVQTVSRIVGSFPADEQDLIRTQLSATLQLVICQQLIPWSNAKGRSMAAEILVATPAVRAMIRENKMHQLTSAMQTGYTMGMRTMSASLKTIYDKGLIDRKTALDWAIDKDDMTRTLASTSV